MSGLSIAKRRLLHGKEAPGLPVTIEDPVRCGLGGPVPKGATPFGPKGTSWHVATPPLRAGWPGRASPRHPPPGPGAQLWPPCNFKKVPRDEMGPGPASSSGGGRGGPPPRTSGPGPPRRVVKAEVPGFPRPRPRKFWSQKVPCIRCDPNGPRVPRRPPMPRLKGHGEIRADSIKGRGGKDVDPFPPSEAPNFRCGWGKTTIETPSGNAWGVIKSVGPNLDRAPKLSPHEGGPWRGSGFAEARRA